MIEGVSSTRVKIDKRKDEMGDWKKKKGEKESESTRRQLVVGGSGRGSGSGRGRERERKIELERSQDCARDAKEKRGVFWG